MHIIENIPKTWKSLNRDDIRHAEMAQQKMGYTVRSREDYNHKYAYVPQESLIFIQGSVWIWTVTGPGWIAADLISGKFTNHRHYRCLMDALKTERSHI